MRSMGSGETSNLAANVICSCDSLTVAIDLFIIKKRGDYTGSTPQKEDVLGFTPNPGSPVFLIVMNERIDIFRC